MLQRVGPLWIVFDKESIPFENVGPKAGILSLLHIDEVLVDLFARFGFEGDI